MLVGRDMFLSGTINSVAEQFGVHSTYTEKVYEQCASSNNTSAGVSLNTGVQGAQLRGIYNLNDACPTLWLGRFQ